MVDHLALCILSTNSRTWILAFGVDACPIRWTISVHNTFRSASLVGITRIIQYALAWTCAILFSANGVRSAWIWHTWCGRQGEWCLLYVALWERISHKSSHAEAHGRVTEYLALGVGSAHTGAWIFALLVQASQVVGTLRVRNAFGFTIGWLPDEVGQTWARGWITNGPTCRIWTTRRWLTRICGLNWQWFSYDCDINVCNRLIRKWVRLVSCLFFTNKSTPREWVTFKTGRTTAYRIVVDYCAYSSDATSSNARIAALLVWACLVGVAFEILCAFRPASRRTSDVARDTWADAVSVNLTTLTIGTAWRRVTRIYRSCN